MFVIVTYDVNSKRVQTIMKICRKYLHHMQNSVFEGMLTQAQLNSLKKELERKIETKTDSICIYKIESIKYTSKEQIGFCRVHENIL